MRLNLPDTAVLPPLVALVSGANGNGVGATEGDGALDVPAGFLANGASLAGRYTDRTSAGVAATLAFNAPGRGRGGTVASPNHEMLRWAADHPGARTNQIGDDYCGPMSMAAFRACVTAARTVMETTYGAVPTYIYLGSFSNGACAAAQYAADPDYPVSAWVDLEGPTNSFEQLCAPYATGLLGRSHDLDDTIGYDDWYTMGVTLTTGSFRDAWEYFYRPPYEVLEELYALYAMHVPELPDLNGVLITQTDVDEGLLFWPARETGTFIASRKCPYLRIQGANDHVQPSTYGNKHAVNALLAALSAGSDVYQVLTPADPALASGVLDPARPGTWPRWTRLPNDPHLPLVDALRWSFANLL